MTRPFRTETDEQRYFTLRTELFLRVCKSGIPSQTVHEIMRALGKMEDFMLLEGVRQGFMSAYLAVGAEEDPLTSHAKLYAGANTPLSARELSVDPTCHGHPWGSTKPLEFAPTTLAEARKAYGEDLAIQPVATVAETPAPERAATRDVDDPMAFLEALAAGVDVKDLLGPAFLSADPLTDPVDVDIDTSPAQRPDLVDRLRDEMKALTEPPKTWADLVLTLTRQTHIASDVIDQALSTPMGMTAISQVNFFHLHPGAYPDKELEPRAEPGGFKPFNVFTGRSG